MNGRTPQPHNTDKLHKEVFLRNAPQPLKRCLQTETAVNDFAALFLLVRV